MKADMESEVLQRKERRTLSSILPTENLGFEKQARILSACVNAHSTSKKPVTLEQISGMINMPVGSVRLVSPFFQSIGVWQKIGRQGLIPSSEAGDFYHIHQTSEDQASAWARLVPLLESGWYMDRIRKSLHSGTVDQKELVSDLMRDGNLKPNQRARVMALLNLLSLAGIIRREAGKIIKGDLLNFPRSYHVDPGPAVSTRINQPNPAAVVEHRILDNNAVEIRICFTPAMLAGWDSNKLQTFFAGIARLLSMEASH